MEFSLPLYNKIKEETVLKNINEITRPFCKNKNHLNEVILTLAINNQNFKELVHGDLFYDTSDNSLVLFLIIKDSFAIKDLFLYKLKREDFLIIKETLSNKTIYDSHTMTTYLSDYLSYKSELISLKDINLSDIYFLTNFYYEKDILSFLEDLDLKNTDLFYDFFSRLQSYIYHMNEFKIIYKLKNDDEIYKSLSTLIKDDIKSNNLESFRPAVITQFKINNWMNKSFLYLDDIYEHKENSNITGIIKLDDDFSFKLFTFDGKKEIIHLHEKINAKNYHIYHHIENTDIYDKKYLLFI